MIWSFKNPDIKDLNLVISREFTEIDLVDVGTMGNGQMLILFSEDMDEDSIPTHSHGVSGFSIYSIL